MSEIRSTVTFQERWLCVVYSLAVQASYRLDIKNVSHV
jgi:hypothetical protein